MSSENIVKLDIGGTIFRTLKSTLTKFDGMFKTMLETSFPVEKDESGCIFIDRDPFHFCLILNYMRDGDVELPDSLQELKEIQAEAQYYLLEGLDYLCDAKMPVTEISNEIPVIECQAEFNRIIENPIKPVLVFHRPTCLDGSFPCPPGFKLNDFLEKHKHHLDIYFEPFSNPNLPWWWTMKKNDFKFEGSWAARFGSFTNTIERDVEVFLNKFTSIE